MYKAVKLLYLGAGNPSSSVVAEAASEGREVVCNNRAIQLSSRVFRRTKALSQDVAALRALVDETGASGVLLERGTTGGFEHAIEAKVGEIWSIVRLSPTERMVCYIGRTHRAEGS